jgi:hypothetical protein
MATDITFTAGLNPSQFEKGVQRIEELGRRAARVGRGMGGGGGDGAGGDDRRGGRGGGLLEQAVRFTAIEKAAKRAYAVAIDGARLYGRESASAQAEVNRWDAALKSASVSVGRLVVNTGALAAGTAIVKSLTDAYMGMGDAVARVFRGGEVDEFNRAIAQSEAIEKRTAALGAVNDERRRLRAGVAGVGGDDVGSARLAAAEKYEAALKRIAATGGTEAEQNELRGLARQERALAIQSAIAKRAEEEDRKQKAREEEAARLDKQDADRMKERLEDRARAMEAVNEAAVRAVRAQGNEDAAAKLEILLDLEQRRARVMETELLTIEERARLLDAEAASARAQIEGIDESARRSRAAKAQAEIRRNARVLDGGFASRQNIAQVFGSGRSAPLAELQVGVKAAVELLRKIVGNTAADSVMRLAP